MALKPCPNCGWMCNDADAACNMCGKPTGFAGARPAAPPAPPPPVAGPGGAYAAPGPPGAGYPAPAPPPPVSPGNPYGAAAPPPPVSPGGGYGGGAPQFGGGGYGQPPPPVAAPGGAFSGGYGNQAPVVNEAVSPWAAAAAPAPQAAPPPAPPPPPPPAPQQNPYGAPAYAQQPSPQYAPAAPAPAYPPGPAYPGQASPPGPVAPPPVVGPGGVIAPPPPVPAVLGAPGAPNYAQSPMMRTGMAAPPPMVSSGGIPGMVGIPSIGQAPGPTGSRVLVGFLVTFQNDPNGAFWAIHSGRLQLGRAAASGAADGTDVGLPDPSASSRHASIYADPSTGQAYVEDDGSRNGTFLNEQRLNPGERRQLRDSDRLRIGSTTFVVKLLVS